jgi:signal recognition particle receptor subunit beta
MSASQQESQQSLTPSELVSLGEFGRLPRDVRNFVLAFLGPAELSRMAQCCKTLARVCNDEILWETIHLASGGSHKRADTWKNSFIQRYGPSRRPRAAESWGETLFGPLSAMMRAMGLQKMQEKKSKVLLVGLDAAGKTTILYTVKGINMVPLNDLYHGMAIEMAHYRNIEFISWDVGGSCSQYELLNAVLSGARRHKIEGLVFVVDSNERSLIRKAGSSLWGLLRQEELSKAFVLVLAHKQDLPHALHVEDVVDEMGLLSLNQQHRWHIVGSCAVPGKEENKIQDGFDWLEEQIK